MADSSLHSVFYVAETVYGTTPATPAFKPFRQTKCSLGLSKNTLVSAEAQAHGQIQDLRHGAKNVSGDIGVELSALSFDDMLEACMLGTWASNVLKIGSTRRSFSIQRRFPDLASNNYHTFTGVEVSAFEVAVSADAMATGTFSFIGKGLSLASTQITGATDLAVSTTSPFDSFTGTINEGGSSIGVVTEIKFKVDNKLAPRFVIGSSETARPSRARLTVTGTLTAYFENATLLNKFINETTSSISFTLVDGTNSLQFTLPRIKYTGGQPDTTSEGPITLAMPFQALYDSSSATSLTLTKG